MCDPDILAHMSCGLIAHKYSLCTGLCSSGAELNSSPISQALRKNIEFSDKFLEKLKVRVASHIPPKTT